MRHQIQARASSGINIGQHTKVYIVWCWAFIVSAAAYAIYAFTVFADNCLPLTQLSYGLKFIFFTEMISFDALLLTLYQIVYFAF